MAPLAVTISLLLLLLVSTTPSIASPQPQPQPQPQKDDTDAPAATVYFFPAISTLLEILSNSKVDGFAFTSDASSTVWTANGKRDNIFTDGPFDTLTLIVTNYASTREVITYVPNEAASGDGGRIRPTFVECTLTPSVQAICVTSAPSPGPTEGTITLGKEAFSSDITFIITEKFTDGVATRPVFTSPVSETTVHETTTRGATTSTTTTTSTSTPEPSPEPSTEDPQTTDPEFTQTIIGLSTTVPTGIPTGITPRPPPSTDVPGSAVGLKVSSWMLAGSFILMGWFGLAAL